MGTGSEEFNFDFLALQKICPVPMQCLGNLMGTRQQIMLLTGLGVITGSCLAIPV